MAGAALALAAVLPILTGAAQAQPASLPDGIRGLLAAARTEGEVRVFGMTLAPPQIQALSESISKFYGIPLELKMTGGSQVAKAAEIALASRQGVPSGFDVFWTANIAVLVEHNLLREVDWVGQLGVERRLASGNRYGVPSHHDMLDLITYNKDIVRAADAPRAFDGLLDPRWRGRVAIPRDPTPWAYLAAAIGEPQTDSLLKRFVADQQPRILPRVPEVRAQVIAGQFALGLGTDAFLDIRKGAPVEHAAVSPLILSPQSVNILKDARNVNAAILFGYWLSTTPGQQALSQITGRSLVTSAGTELNRFAQGKQVVIISNDFLLKELPRLSDKYAGMLGIK